MDRARVIRGCEIGIEGSLLALLVVFPLSHMQAAKETCFFLALALFLVRAVVDAGWSWPRSSLDRPILLFLGWVIISLVSAPDLRYSARWVVQKLGKQLAVYYLAVSAFRTDPMRQRAILVMLGGALAISSVATVKFFMDGGTLFDRHVRAGFPTGEYNWLSTYLVMALPFAFCFMNRSRHGVTNLFLAIGVAAGGVALLLTYTRAAWLAFVAQIALFVTGGTRRRSVLGIMIVALILLAIACSFAGNMVLKPINDPRLQEIDPLSPKTISTRFEVWKFGLKVIAEHPLTGIGYGRESFHTMYSTAPLTHLHNTFLETAAQVGIPGVVLLIWIFWRIVGTLVGQVSESGGGFERELALGLLLMVVGVIIRNLFDDMFIGPIAQMFWLLVGIGFSSKVERASPVKRGGGLMREHRSCG